MHPIPIVGLGPSMTAWSRSTWKAAARLLDLEVEETRKLGAVAAIRQQLAKAKCAQLAARRTELEPLYRGKVEAFDAALENAAVACEDLRLAWESARQDGVTFDAVFWRSLLPKGGSRLSDWRETLRREGWLKPEADG